MGLLGRLAGRVAPAPGLAEETAAEAPRPGFESRRFDEDWSALADATAPARLLDRIKYVPLDRDGDFWLSLGGQLRARVEFWNGFLFGASEPKSDDVYGLGRVRLHADLHLSRYFRVFAEFKGAFATDRELAGKRRPVDQDTAALQNGFAEARLPLDRVVLGARGGRQELLFGAQRLVSPLDWANARRTFDGALAYGSGERFDVTGFWTHPVTVRQYGFNESDGDSQFFGVYSTFRLPPPFKLGLDLYWLGLDRDEARASNGTTGAELRHTLGGQLFGRVSGTPLRIDAEAAAQFGTVGSETIRAGMFSAVLTWPFPSTRFEPDAYVGLDWASGDNRPGGEVGTFDQLFPLAHAYFGYIDAIARQNIWAVHGGAGFSPVSKSRVALTWHAFWLDNVNDALYAASGSPIRFDPTAGSRQVGVEMDLTLTYTFLPGVVGLVGYSHFFTGQYLADSGPDQDVDFGYVQLQYTF